MALRNKDGSEYTLSKPNPVMASQELWDETSYVLHNKFGKLVEDRGSEKSIIRVREPIIPQKPNEPTIVEAIKVPTAAEIENKIQVWCLPGFITEVVDPLYGEKYNKVSYGKKFVFEAILEDHNDLYIKMWVNTKSVTIGSILYPRISEKRWWRVKSILKEKEMFLITADAADYHPDFST
jgi:hypothetical protein